MAQSRGLWPAARRTLRLGRRGRGRVEVDNVLPPKEDEVEGGSERLVREGTRSVDAVEVGGWSGVVSDGGFGGGRMAVVVVGRGGGGIIEVALLILEIVGKGFRFDES